MKLVQACSIGGREILAFDAVIPARDHAVLGRSLEDLPYMRKQIDSQQTRKKYVYFSAQLEARVVHQHQFVQATLALVKKHFPDERNRLALAYVNQVSYGDITFAHRDYPKRSRLISAVYFANPRWRSDWGGETLFFDDKANAQVAVSPRPGRLILFRGSLVHRIGVPSRRCTVSRFTVALKFR